MLPVKHEHDDMFQLDGETYVFKKGGVGGFCTKCHFGLGGKMCPRDNHCDGGYIIKLAEELMSTEHVTLTSDYGKYKAGASFEVVKANKETTVCLNEKGKRVIFSNKYLSEKDTPVLELTPMQVDKIYLPLTKAHKADEDILDDEYLGTLNNKLRDDYPEFDKMTKAALQEDLVFIAKAVIRGIKVISKGGGIMETAKVGASMSAAEREALEKMLAGEGLDEDVLGVTNDTPPEAEKPPELTENQRFLTDVTGGLLPTSKINHIINMYPADHFPEDQRGYIPEVKDTHEWDPDVLETLILAHEMREKSLITGLPGTGKSSSVEQFAAWIRQPYTRIGGRGDLETADLVGQLLVTVDVLPDGTHVPKQEFKPGILALGLLNGHLVTIDEVMKIPSYIQMCMQHLYEKDGYLTVSDIPGTAEDKKVLPIAEFLLILTDNVKGTGDGSGKFAATQIQDTSTLDRISLNETLDYLSPDREKKMLLKVYPSADKPIVTKLIKFANLVRNGYKAGEVALTLSPRGLIAILGMVDRGIPVKRAIELAFSNKIADEAEQVAINGMLTTVALVKK